MVHLFYHLSKIRLCILKDILLLFLSIVFVQIVSLQSFSIKVVLWLRVVIKFITVHNKILTGSAVFVVTTKNKIFISRQSFLNLSPFSEQFSFFSQLCGQFNQISILLQAVLKFTISSLSPSLATLE